MLNAEISASFSAFFDGLVFAICCHLGDVPVAWKEDEEFARIAVIETGLLRGVIIMYHVGTVLAVGGTGVMVDDAKTLCSLHYILKIDVLVMTLAAALFQRLVPAFQGLATRASAY